MKKVVCIFFALTCLLCLSYINFDYSVEPCAYLDNDSDSWPKRYRTTQSALLTEKIVVHGLDRLCGSGSGQFSEEGLMNILKSISAKNVTVVDLRQESHGFINGRPVLWVTNAHNDANKDKRVDEIEEDEKQRFKKVYENSKVLLYSESGSEEISAHSVKTERQVVERLGYIYLRFPVQDHHRPSDQIVDEFVRLIVSLPVDNWLYMHCKGGSGRTTTFMTMYDMMINAQKLSLDEILKRQHLLGGKDLCELGSDTFKYKAAVARLEFIKAFYKYCKDEPNFNLSWSDWIQKQSQCVFLSG